MPKRNPPTCRGKIPRGLTHTHATQKGEPKREPLIMPTVARVIVEWLVPTILLHPLHIQLEPPPPHFFSLRPQERVTKMNRIPLNQLKKTSSG